LAICVKFDIDGLSVSAHIWDVNNLARDSKQIGNIIRRARKKRTLSHRTGLRQETISLIENGNPAARIKTLLAVLAALDLEFQIAARSKVEQGGETYF
jgi:HTH-type transcriptional regulator / antitoxin HipB